MSGDAVSDSSASDDAAGTVSIERPWATLSALAVRRHNGEPQTNRDLFESWARSAKLEGSDNPSA